MASLWKKGRMWFFTSTDSRGRRVERKGAADKARTARMAAEADPRVREGVDPETDGRAMAVVNLVDEYVAGLHENGRAAKDVATVGSRLRLALTGVATPGDLRASSVGQWLQTRRADGLSAQTVAHYVVTLRAFDRWVTKRRLLANNLLAGMDQVGGSRATGGGCGSRWRWTRYGG